MKEYPKYPIFKGLQMPLEFMGLRGRFIIWAAITAGVSFLSFVAAFILLGTAAGFITLISFVGSGLGIILKKQKQGLHTKKRYRGIYIYNNIQRIN